MLLAFLLALPSAGHAAIVHEGTSVWEASGTTSRLFVLARGLNNGIYYTVCNPDDGKCDLWKQLPGSTPDAPSAVYVRREHRVYIVVRGMDNGIYIGYIDPNTWKFSGWMKLPGSTPSRPVLAYDEWIYEMIALVVRGMNNRVYYNIYFFSNSSWSGWKRLPSGSTIDAPAAAITDTGLHIVVRGGDGRSLWYATLERYYLEFSGWTKLPGSTPSAPSMVSDGYFVYIAVRGMDNRIYLNSGYGGELGNWARVSTGSTVATPAITPQGHVAVIGSDGKSIWYTQVYFNGTQLLGWIKIPGSSSSPLALVQIPP